jgi:two-component system nitrogen regulation sensor histidine kinase GlnL
MLERLSTAIVELDHDGRVCLMNSAAEHSLGASRERAFGQRLAESRLVPAPIMESIEASLGDGETRYLHECRLAGGQYDCHITCLENGRILLELHAMKWEKRRRQLQQREIQTGILELLRRNLGHEIRNPLGGIRGAAQMMAEELSDPDMRSLARLVMRESDRIDELIRRFGQPELNLRSMHLHLVLDESLELLGVETSGGIDIRQDYDPSIPELVADATALRQVLLNLLLNAHQAGATQICVRTRVVHGESLLQGEKGSLVRIDIDDDGVGVPESIRALLFLPMVTGRRDGTGLGLALSQQIAAAHGGLLTFEPLDSGSRFSLRIPLEQADD